MEILKPSVKDISLFKEIAKNLVNTSAGRVQSPTLAMIVDREEEIRSFKPVDYYTINASAKGFKLSWADNKGNSSIYNEGTAKGIVAKTQGAEGEVIDVTKSLKKKYSAPLYDLTELQRDANKIWGYSAKETLNYMQRLYENYKLLTYPRTDSRYVTTDIVATIPDRLKAIGTGEYRVYAEQLLRQGVKGGKAKFYHDNQTGKKCPNCGKYLLEVNGKNGRMLVCQDRECGYRENLARLTNARCPECKKKLELRGQGEGKIYVCPGTNCNFREKATQFEKRFDKNGKVDKRQVNNYMKKLKKEAEQAEESPFAALLGGLKFDDK